MRLGRVEHAGASRWAVLEADSLWLVEHPWHDADRRGAEPIRTGEVLPLEGARLLAPAAALNVVGMAHNTGLTDRDLPPQAFLKPARAVVGTGSSILIPPGIGRVDVEGELAVVIGRTARHLGLHDALDHVLGFTLANDVTARDLQATDPLWTTAKGSDGWTPLGPWLETDLDPSAVQIDLSINGVALRPGSTADLGRSVVEVLVYVTSFMTLGPGDVVLTGAPGESGPVHPGDSVVVSSPALGRLTGRVAADATRAAVGAPS